MKYKITARWENKCERNTVILNYDDWDDFGYKTTFHGYYYDSSGNKHELGTVKIAKKGMTPSNWTKDYLRQEFDSLPDDFFSLWQTAEAYKRVLSCQKHYNIGILSSLNDIAFNPVLFEKYKDEKVLEDSLFRTVSHSTYMKQFRRIAKGEAVLTPYDFTYRIPNPNPLVSDCSLSFSVIPDSLPPTNVHAIIGSNGTGKTTHIKEMIISICKKGCENGRFSYNEPEIEDNYFVVSDTHNGIFENIICISFSPFDDYSKVEDNNEVKFIGIRKEYGPSESLDRDGEISLLDEIRRKYIESLEGCWKDVTKRNDLQEILQILETEFNFLSANYEFEIDFDTSFKEAKLSMEKAFDQLSAGHKVVLSIIVRCIDELVEKSIVFIDEPENHLHPPLLSSLIRGLSRMLTKRNAVAIVSTHSPIVLQEIPKSNVWILNRQGDAISVRRPDIETFGTNIGILTSEIFGYEVRNTGFITMLQETVDKCSNYEEVLSEFHYQLGDEAKSIIRIMLKQKEE